MLIAIGYANLLHGCESLDELHMSLRSFVFLSTYILKCDRYKFFIVLQWCKNKSLYHNVNCILLELYHKLQSSSILKTPTGSWGINKTRPSRSVLCKPCGLLLVKVWGLKFFLGSLSPGWFGVASVPSLPLESIWEQLSRCQRFLYGACDRSNTIFVC